MIDIVDDLNRYAEVSSHPATMLDAAAEIALLRRMMVECEVGFEKLAKENRRLRAALESVMIGGNHLVSIIGVTHPQVGTHHNAALEFYGPGHQYDAWCCWNAIMLVRAALAQGGDK